MQADFLQSMTKPFTGRLNTCVFLLLLLVGLCLLTFGCITPLSPEQQSDWRWKQQNPEYRPPYPPSQ